MAVRPRGAPDMGVVKWTAEMERVLRREYPSARGAAGVAALAARLGVSLQALRTRAQLVGVRRRLAWTAAQKRALRELYGREPAPRIARRIGRPLHQVHRMAAKLGLAWQPRVRVTPEVLGEIRTRNARGDTDTMIAGALGCDRHTVSRHRKAMGLPGREKGEVWLAGVRAGLARQLERSGLASAGQLRRESYRAYARECGWPEDLRPRSVQILNLLAAAGVPLDRRQIAEGIGMPWKGTRNSLASNDPEGSYLAHLAARGLVLRLPRAKHVLGEGRGRTCDLYCLGPGALAILQQRAERAREALDDEAEEAARQAQ